MRLTLEERLAKYRAEAEEKKLMKKKLAKKRSNDICNAKAKKERAKARKIREREKAKIKAKEERKKAREKEKKKAIFATRAKLAKKKSNHKYYLKLKERRKESRRLTNDVYGFFFIYIMKNRKKKKLLGRFRYKNDAIKKFYELVEENHNSVQFPLKYTNNGNRLREHLFEIILVGTLEDKYEDDAYIRDENGKLIKNIVIDREKYKILHKDKWLIEETFNVYGYHPQFDRKDYNFIKNELILNDVNDYSRVFVYGNSLIHHFDDDFHLIRCKLKEQAYQLYDKLEKDINKKEYPKILFMGEASNSNSSWILNEIEEKTGWPRYSRFFTNNPQITKMY